jgi:hypothetical protein
LTSTLCDCPPSNLFCQTSCTSITADVLYAYSNVYQPSYIVWNAATDRYEGYSCYYSIGGQSFNFLQYTLGCALPPNPPFLQACSLPWLGAYSSIGFCGAVTVNNCNPFDCQTSLPTPDFHITENPFDPAPIPAFCSSVPIVLYCDVNLQGFDQHGNPLAPLNGTYPLAQFGPCVWIGTVPYQGGLATITFGGLTATVPVSGPFGTENILFGISIFYNMTDIAFDIIGTQSANLQCQNTFFCKFVYINSHFSTISGQLGYIDLHH